MLDFNKKDSDSIALLLLTILGILEALKSESLSINLAEHLLFKPATMKVLKMNGYPQYLIDLIHAGTELDDVKVIVGDDAYLRALNAAIESVQLLLKDMK